MSRRQGARSPRLAPGSSQGRAPAAARVRSPQRFPTASARRQPARLPDRRKMPRAGSRSRARRLATTVPASPGHQAAANLVEQTKKCIPTRQERATKNVNLQVSERGSTAATADADRHGPLLQQRGPNPPLCAKAAPATPHRDRLVVAPAQELGPGRHLPRDGLSAGSHSLGTYERRRRHCMARRSAPARRTSRASDGAEDRPLRTALRTA